MNYIFGIKTIENEEFSKNLEVLFNLIPDSERAKYLIIKNPETLQRSLLGEVLTRYILKKYYNIDLKNTELKRNQWGKPYFDEISVHFNISHSGKWVLVCFSDKPIGIDIEKIRDFKYNVANKYFSEEELFLLENEDDISIKRELFYKIWTSKEAYVKMLGKGITYSFQKFSVKINNNEGEIKDKSIKENAFIKFYHIEAGYIIACCSISNTFVNSPKIITLKELTQIIQ